MSALCRVGWHKWDRWRFTRVRHTNGRVGEGQFRACRKCGIEQVRA